MKIFAHRGFSGKYPENTMLAFKKAVEMGVDGIEMDVHLSKDGIPVIIHDEKLMRTTGKVGTVQDYSLVELEKIDAGQGQGIPSFEEFCAYMKDKKTITNIELKTNITWYDDIEEKVAKIVDKYGLQDRIIYSSFNWASIIKIKEIRGKEKLAFLQEGVPVQNMGKLCQKLGIDYYHPFFMGTDKNFTDNCHKYGVGVNVWTVNTNADITFAVNSGVDAIISNNPDYCLQWFKR